MRTKTKKVTRTTAPAKTVRYGRLKNLGNFENERIEIEVEVMKGETTAQAFARAKGEADYLLGLASTPEGILELAEKALKAARRREKSKGAMTPGGYDPDYDDDSSIPY